MEELTTKVYLHEDKYWVYELKSGTVLHIYQDVDHINGGRILTEERANELVKWELDRYLNPPPPPEREPTMAELKHQIEDLSIALAAILGGAI